MTETSANRDANGDPRPAAVTFVTTEHFTLQGARAATIAESNGRASVLWRAGLRMREALELGETDLDATRGAVIARKGKGGRPASSAWTDGRGISSSAGARSDLSYPSARSCA